MPKGETITELLTPEQAAEFLCVKPQTMACWRMDGVGPSYHRIGRLIRYRKSDLVAWLESRRVTVAAPALAGA